MGLFEHYFSRGDEQLITMFEKSEDVVRLS